MNSSHLKLGHKYSKGEKVDARVPRVALLSAMRISASIFRYSIGTTYFRPNFSSWVGVGVLSRKGESPKRITLAPSVDSIFITLFSSLGIDCREVSLVARELFSV